MKVTHVIESIAPQFGGPPSVVMHLAAAQAALGADVEVVTYRDADNQYWLSEWRHQIPLLQNLPLREIERGWRFTAGIRRDFRALHDGTDIMHVHGIWRSLAWHALSTRLAGRAATVLAPHGMLSPWALKHNGIRKKLAMRAVWRRMIAAADVMHAVSLGEVDEIKECISSAQIALIPNGVAIMELIEDAGETTASGPDSSAAGSYVLYVARLHEMKGPDLLIDAFAEVVKGNDQCSGLRLIMAGPDFGELAALKARVRRLRIEHRVHFPGPVYDKVKRDLYRGATLVCQPSRYEAFSLSLLEALGAGIPVLTTPEANFPEVHTCGAGIICNGESRELAKHMRRLLLQPELRESMGQQGRALVQNHYTWERVAIGAIKVYGDLLEARKRSN